VVEVYEIPSVEPRVSLAWAKIGDIAEASITPDLGPGHLGRPVLDYTGNSAKLCLTTPPSTSIPITITSCSTWRTALYPAWLQKYPN